MLSSSDIGLPLAPVGRAALLPANVAAFADGLDVPEEDVRLYLALREAAHQRLFAHVPWLTAHLVAAVEDFGRGTTIDVEGIESKMREIDPTNPAAMQEALQGGLFEPERTPSQQAALVRLETMLALVEGWVDEVVTQATEGRMPNAGKLQEIVRRRRAAGGPAEDAFAALVGLELRPRRLRDAAALWGSLRSRKGAAARDAVWAHPDLLPSSTDLDDPLGFGEQRRARERRDRLRRRLRRGAGEAARRGGGLRLGLRRPRRPGRPSGADRVTPRRAPALSPAVSPTVSTAHADALEACCPRGVLRRSPRSGCGSGSSRGSRRAPTPSHRSCRPEHLTASTLVLSPDGAEVLLTLHAKAQRWFQLGGHVEPGDPTLADAALREATEESGLCGLSLDPGPVHLDAHEVPFCGGVDEPTWHLDVRFVAVGGPGVGAPGQRGVVRGAVVACRRPAQRRAVAARARRAGPCGTQPGDQPGMSQGISPR